MTQERSEQELEEALAAQPRDRITRTELAVRYLMGGRAEAALEQARITLALAPDDVSALGVAALAADMLGDRVTSLGCDKVMAALRIVEVAPPVHPSNQLADYFTQPRPVAAGAGGGVRWGRRSTDRIGRDGTGVGSDATGDGGGDADGTGARRAEELPRGVLPSRRVRPIEPLPHTSERRRRADALLEPDWTLFATNPRVTFTDIAGMTELKWRLQRLVVEPGDDTARTARREVRNAGATLLYGPRGCAKATVAEAVAGQIGAKVVRVALDEVLRADAETVEERLVAAFRLAHEVGKCIVIVEDLDLVCGQSGHRRSAPMVAADVLAREIAAVVPGGPVTVICTSTRPWLVQGPLRAPGVIGRLVLVPGPDASARVRIVSDRLINVPLAADISAGEIAMLTEGCSANDLVHLCARAAEHALVASKNAGVVWPVAQRDLLRAVTHADRTADAWFGEAYRVLAYGNATGDYDQLFDHIRRNVRHVMR